MVGLLTEHPKSSHQCMSMSKRKQLVPFLVGVYREGGGTLAEGVKMSRSSTSFRTIVLKTQDNPRCVTNEGRSSSTMI